MKNYVGPDHQKKFQGKKFTVITKEIVPKEGTNMYFTG